MKEEIAGRGGLVGRSTSPKFDVSKHHMSRIASSGRCGREDRTRKKCKSSDSQAIIRVIVIIIVIVIVKGLAIGKHRLWH